MPPKFDERDQAILAGYQRRRDESYCGKPRVGDIIRLPDGKKTRVTYVWDDHCQTVGKHGPSSFHVMWNGNCSYSGSLTRGVQNSDLKPTGEQELASVWFFHHELSMAHNGVNALLLVHVFESAVAEKE